MVQPDEPPAPKIEASVFTFQQNNSLFEPSKDEVKEQLNSLEHQEVLIPEIFKDWERIDPLSKNTAVEFSRAIKEV